MTLPVQPQPLRMLLHLTWFLVWLLSEGVLLIAVFGGPGVERTQNPAPQWMLKSFLVVFTAAGMFVLWRGLWYLTGREVILVGPETLAMSREIAKIRRTRYFELAHVQNLRVEDLHYRVIYPSWGRMFIGHGRSQIVFDYERASYAFARGLEEEQATNLLKFLKNGMSLGPRPSTWPASLKSSE